MPPLWDTSIKQQKNSQQPLKTIASIMSIFSSNPRWTFVLIQWVSRAEGRVELFPHGLTPAPTKHPIYMQLLDYDKVISESHSQRLKQFRRAHPGHRTVASARCYGGREGEEREWRKFSRDPTRRRVVKVRLLVDLCVIDVLYLLPYKEVLIFGLQTV